MEELLSPVDQARKDKLTSIKSKTKRRVGIVTTAGQDYYMVGPTRPQWHQFRDAVADTKRKRVAMENLAASCCVDPGSEALQLQFEDLPALAETLALKVTELAGFDEAVELRDFGIV